MQKWVYNTQTSSWILQYDISLGLNLVNNANANSNTPTAPGVTGLFGLTGEDVDVNGVEEVELFATSYGLNELSPSYLYEVTDVLDSSTLAISGGLDDFTALYERPGRHVDPRRVLRPNRNAVAGIMDLSSERSCRIRFHHDAAPNERLRFGCRLTASLLC